MLELKDKIERKRVFDEFANRAFILTNTTKDIKVPNICLTYPTTRSAFIFPISGEAIIHFDNEKIKAKPGMVIHGCSNKKLSFQVTTPEPFSHINIYYDCFDDGKYYTNFMNSIFYFETEDYGSILELLSQMHELSIQSDLKFKLKQITLFHSILELLFLTKTTSNYSRELIEDAIQYIQQHYDQEISLQSLANEFQMTPQQFSYLFHKITGIRPINYLINFRLERATWLLKSNMPIKEIALSVGYTDPFYFSRLFKRHFGVSPSQFKKGLLCEELRLKN